MHNKTDLYILFRFRKGNSGVLRRYKNGNYAVASTFKMGSYFFRATHWQRVNRDILEYMVDTETYLMLTDSFFDFASPRPSNYINNIANRGL